MEPFEVHTHYELDRLREESIIVTSRGFYYQRIGPDDWAEPGVEELVQTNDMPLPVLVLFEPQR